MGNADKKLIQLMNNCSNTTAKAITSNSMINPNLACLSVNLFGKIELGFISLI